MSNKYPGGIITSGANAGYSVFFDGNGDFLTVPNNSAFLFGAGDFTVEFWVNFSSISATYQCIAAVWQGSTNYAWNISINNASVSFAYGNGGSSGSSVTFACTPTTNTWAHFAVTRASNSVRCFLNGAQIGTTQTISNNLTSGTSLYIGANQDAGPTQYVNGYVSNLRIIKGTALYTAAFTPPTQLLAITNTSLLTCNSPAIVDQSSNNFTITANGNAAVSTFTPFQGYVAYNPALGAATPGIWTVSDAIQAAQTRRWNMYDPYFNYTTLLLHGNGTNGAQNNTVLDSSSNNFTITRNGNTTQGTFSPFSQTGWSNFFNGSNAYLSIGSNAVLAPGTGNFWVECWINLSNLPSSGTTYAVLQNDALGASTNDKFWFGVTNSAGTYRLQLGRHGTSDASYVNWTPSIGVWYHIAYGRSSGTSYLFIDGVSQTVTGSLSGISFGQNGVVIGAVSTPYYFPGYISNLRYIVGAVLYTSTFTPSTTPLTTTSQGASSSQVEILTCQDNRFIDNSSNAFAITVNGSPSVQAFSPFYPVVAYTPQAQGGSGYFDGTTDYLTVANNTALQVGSGDFTIEGWYYPTNSPSQADIFTKYSAGSQEWGVIDSSSSLGFYAGTGGASWTLSPLTFGTVKVNQWNHFAVCRSGNTFSTFLNGTRGATTTNSFTIGATTISVGIGSGNGFSGSFVNGYVSNYRIVKGTAVYDVSQTSITVPTAPFTNITNTSLLCNFTNAGIVDSTAKNVLETVSNVQVSTTQSKFGSSSMWFQAGGTLAMANNPGLSFGTGDFTVEWWVYWNTVPSASVGFVSGAGSGSTDIRYDGTNLRLGRFLVAFDSTFAWTAVTGQWYHVAVTRQGTSVRAFVNGTQIGTTSTNSNTYNAVGNFYIGTVTFGSPGDTPLAYIDDFRITKGYARYTANFTPQTSQWQDQ